MNQPHAYKPPRSPVGRALSEDDGPHLGGGLKLISGAAAASLGLRALTWMAMHTVTGTDPEHVANTIGAIRMANQGLVTLLLVVQVVGFARLARVPRLRGVAQWTLTVTVMTPLLSLALPLLLPFQLGHAHTGLIVIAQLLGVLRRGSLVVLLLRAAGGRVPLGLHGLHGLSAVMPIIGYGVLRVFIANEDMGGAGQASTVVSALHGLYELLVLVVGLMSMPPPAGAMGAGRSAP